MNEQQKAKPVRKIALGTPAEPGLPAKLVTLRQPNDGYRA